MARFYRLKLENVYFTSTGTGAGLPCRVELEGVSGLLGNVVVTSIDRQNDGSVKAQTLDTQKRGVELVAKITGSIKAAVFNQLNDLIQTALAAGSPLVLSASGGASPAAFTVSVVAMPPTRAGFSNDRIRGAEFRFITI